MEKRLSEMRQKNGKNSNKKKRLRRDEEKLNFPHFTFIMLSLVVSYDGLKSVVIKINKDCFT